ncbi:MAG: hypothetical protein QW727_03810 [Candidatus Pacearchaeota archaeon]
MPSSSFFTNPNPYTIDKDVFASQYLVDVAGGGVLGAFMVAWNVGRQVAIFPDFSNSSKLIRASSVPRGVVEIYTIFGINPLGTAWLTDLSKGCSTGDIVISHTSSPCTGAPVTQRIKFKSPVVQSIQGRVEIQHSFFISILTFFVGDAEYVVE